MKKLFSLLMVAMLSMQAVPAFAADEEPVSEIEVASAVEANIADYIEPRYAVIKYFLPVFDIEDGRASCSVDVRCKEDSANITVNVVLYKKVGSGKSVIDSWTLKDTGELTWSEVFDVSSGSYTMSVDVTVTGSGGKDHTNQDCTARC